MAVDGPGAPLEVPGPWSPAWDSAAVANWVQGRGQALIQARALREHAAAEHLARQQARQQARQRARQQQRARQVRARNRRADAASLACTCGARLELDDPRGVSPYLAVWTARHRGAGHAEAVP